MKFALIVLLSVLGLSLGAQSPVSSALLRTLQTEESTNIIISFKKTDLEAARSGVRLASYPTKAAKRADLRARLTNHFDEIASDVYNFIAQFKSASQQVEKLWVTNEIVVRGADLALVQRLERFVEIAEIRQTKMVAGPKPLNVKPYTGPLAGEQWGVADMNAPAAWAAGVTGEGVTVMTLDTGVRRNHVALRNGFRSHRGWLEPGKETDTPHDVVGHGTHVTGTIAGNHNGVGVAPAAQWIACLGCRAAGCTEEDLKACGQWAICPLNAGASPPDTNPNCLDAPDIISNSWGGGNEDPFYDEIIQTWLDAGIVPIFAIGNAGPLCKTANSPGDSPLAISVGSINDQRHVSLFSSLGPTTVTGRIQPDIAAPGTDIVSSYFAGDESYYTMSGTSMATPHVAGFVALLLQADPTLTPEGVRELLTTTAIPHASQLKNCGGVSDSVFPNNHVGYGVLEADVTLGISRKH